MNYSKHHTLFLLPILGMLIFSCSPKPYADINKAHKKQVEAQVEKITATPAVKQDASDTTHLNDLWVGTSNFSIRKPNFVVIHHTAQDSLEQTIYTFTIPRTQVSSHYVISRDGTTVQMLNDYLRSWHAGRGKWGHDTDLNSSSLGIELDNNGSEPFTDAQIESLIKLLKKIKEDYNIPAANFIGHADLAPGRKVDPSVHFPWKRLAEQGFGLWYDDFLLMEIDVPSEGMAYKTETVMLESVPDSFDPLEALRIVGYDISDPDAAIQSFKLHFIQADIDQGLSKNDIRILHNLYKKYL
ncbi:N-acetylmuramoyl-L-alanine amidase [Echinicola strongylocentroti]|uniref:N-acetylmuramoyl-L-alanine amidase n=1 Tax=Echinicola strongylocentroti TaxID=1795355 RepID=A0A2Z4IL69_9BACT|nr:N-acetylmuramoyl-L-alanine amidase [Echinicola strongylocentroti]AWW31470.1 N-acetylmuramoyl-L-alanine amidase [Echinicola strongylocentroti]